MSPLRDVELVDGLVEYQLTVYPNLDVVYSTVEPAVRSELIFCEYLDADGSSSEDRNVEHEIVPYSFRIEFKTAKPVVNARVDVERAQRDLFNSGRKIIRYFREAFYQQGIQRKIILVADIEV